MYSKWWSRMGKGTDLCRRFFFSFVCFVLVHSDDPVDGMDYDSMGPLESCKIKVSTPRPGQI